MNNIFVQELNGDTIDNELTEYIKDVCEIVIFEKGGSRSYDIDVFLTDDDNIREVNQKNRRIDKATDVLSFPNFDGEPSEIDRSFETGNYYLGEILISLETAKVQAENLNQSLERECVFLTLHGMLHLFGFDHIDIDEENKMLEAQRALMEKIENIVLVDEDELTLLIETSREVLVNSYAPYSNFNVASCIMTYENEIYTGVNIEVSSFSASICAERVSIFKALSEGEKNIKLMVISSSQEDFVYPCGICLQVMSDFFKPWTKIVITNREEDYIVYRIGDLLPKPFTEFNGGII